MTKKYILTGAPGSGKSAIVLELEQRGEIVVREAAEDIIKLNQAKGIERPWELENFQDQILDLQIQREYRIPRTLGYAIIDRGILDGLAYLNMESKTAKRINEELGRDSRIPYSKTIFLIEQLGTIDKNKVRREDYLEALKLEKKFEGIYQEYGFNIERIPALPVKERADIILKIIGRGK
jgi:predicted ATPase